MRSPWLSREYKKSDLVTATKIKENGRVKYELSKPGSNIKCVLTNEEYKKYEKNKLNEIEWERLFLNGLAEDINGGSVEIEEELNGSIEYKKKEEVQSFPLKVEDEKFMILINPDMGSWVALTQEEFDRYEKDELTHDEWKTLFIRGLAETTNGVEVEFDFPAPAEYPSVIVVNITTNCNLRCRYCFADCGSFEGEDMLPEVMDATIDNMLSMPKVKIITYKKQPNSYRHLLHKKSSTKSYAVGTTLCVSIRISYD